MIKLLLTILICINSYAREESISATIAEIGGSNEIALSIEDILIPIGTRLELEIGKPKKFLNSINRNCYFLVKKNSVIDAELRENNIETIIVKNKCPIKKFKEKQKISLIISSNSPSRNIAQEEQDFTNENREDGEQEIPSSPQKVVNTEKNNKGYISPLLGFAIPFGSSSVPFYYGFSVGFLLDKRDSGESHLGFFLTRRNSSTLVSGIPVNDWTTIIGLEFLGRKLYGSSFFVILRLGAALSGISAVVSGVDYSSSGTFFTLGSGFGYDISLSEKFAMSPEISLLNVFGGSTTGNLGTFNYTTSTGLLILMGFKYTF